MKKTTRKVLAATVTAVLLAGAPAQSETLTDALISAYKSSDLLNQNRALLRAADEDVAQSIAALGPVLNFIANARLDDEVSVGTRDSGNVGLSLDWTLFQGGSNRRAVEVAKEAVLQTRAGLVGVEQDVLLNAVSAYMAVRSSIENVALGQSNVRLISEELRAARDRFDVGEVTRTDVSIAEARLAAARSNLVASEGDLRTARESFKRFVGHYPERLTGVPRVPRLPATLEEARALAVRSHPDIIQAQHAVTIGDLNVARARAALAPTVTASASATVDDHGNDDSAVTLNLRQHIYGGGGLNSAVRQAINNREARRAALLDTVRVIEQQVGNAWANLAVARAQIVSSGEQIRAAQIAFDGAKEEVRLGSRTTLDVLDSEQDLLDAKATRINAEADQYVAIYALMSAMGMLTVDHLNLGIQTYDPAAYYNAVKKSPIGSVQGAKLDRVLKSIGKE